MSTQNSNNTGKQGGAPAIPNNWQGKKPADEVAPKGIEGTVDGHNRGKDGTQK